MSLEADKPSAQTQAGSDKFVDGHHPVERVRPFKDGDLTDVHDELLQRGVPDTVPIDPDTLHLTQPVDKIPLYHPEILTAPEKKRKKGLLIGLGGVAAGVGLSVATFLGLNALDSSEKPRSNPDASALPNAGETEPADTNPEVTPEPETLEFGLNTENYVDTPEKLLPDFVDAYNTWQNAGVNIEDVRSDERFEMPIEDYAAQLNAESDEAFLSTMLVPDWVNNPNLVRWVDIALENHKNTSWASLITTESTGTEENVPYERYLDIDPTSIQVESVTGPDVVVSGNWTGRDNSDQNRIGADRAEGEVNVNETSGIWTMTFTEGPNGTMLLADVTYS